MSRQSPDPREDMHGIGRLATVTVTFHPDMDILGAQQRQLPQESLRIIVDNCSSESLRSQLEALAACDGSVLVANDANLGLAAAVNQGVAVAREHGCKSVLLLDQDTEPGEGGVLALVAAYERLRESGVPPACVGPRIIDAATGLEHGFHRLEGWRWVRRYPSKGSVELVPCTNLNGSGTLVPMLLFDRIGGLEEQLFIDHVDTEWAFRVLANGYGLYGVPNVSFLHRMGSRSLRFWWLRWRVWPYRSPLRHRFLYRNTVQLMRRNYVPAVWKGWAALKLLLTFGVHLVFDGQRFPQIAAMAGGICDALAGNDRR